jgi:hypothetical protein
MLQAADQVSIFDVYERLRPESKRVGQRVDFLAWLAAHACQELGALGLEPEEMSLLCNVEANPDDRWTLMSQYWPCLRTTASGRMALRVAWELLGVEDVDKRTWKDVSAHLWREAEKGFYQKLLGGRANIEWVLVDGDIDPGMRVRCASIWNFDRYLSMTNRSDFEDWSDSLDYPISLRYGFLDGLIAESVDQCIATDCLAVKVGKLPEIAVPSREKVVWALGRISRDEALPFHVEPDLQSYMLHRLLVTIEDKGLPLQVHVQGENQIARLQALLSRYPQVRFLGVCKTEIDAIPLSLLGRTFPNLYVAQVGLWRLAPHRARQVLQSLLRSIPASKIFAVGGDLTMVEAVSVQALIVRELIAMSLAEMIIEGALDEDDAILIMDRILYSNAAEYFGLA